MRITVEIPDALAAQARAVADEGGISLDDVIVECLRAHLQRRGREEATEFRITTVAGQGIDPSFAGREVGELAYEEPA